MPINTDNMIFVFGSNLGGIHGAGAAAYARNHKAAMMGIGVGRTGQCYAIPTKGITMRQGQNGREYGVGDTLPLKIINEFVRNFLEYARNNPKMQFQVTCIGCGLAGLKDEDIAPMFVDAPVNCWFDTKWVHWLDVPNKGTDPINRKYWGTF